MLALAVYLSAEFIARVLPRTLVERIAVRLARFAFWLRLPARRRLEENLAWLDRPCTGATAVSIRARARAAFEHFALSIIDFLTLSRLDGRDLRDRIEVRGAEHLAFAEASGRGVIVLSAHSGCWEWGAAYLAALGRRVHVVARQHSSPWVERFFARRRGRWQVSRLCGGPLWIAASRALRAREWVALTGDRDATIRLADRVAKPSVCAWVAALSHRTGALILPAVMLRLGNGRYAACFDRPLTAESCLDGGYRDALRRLLADHGEQWSAFEPLPACLSAD
jgi:Kdo2-lipid IVA lauroyltransferase/acyltransferase